MKVLIAGGAGFIGSTVASACLDAGISPVILDSLVTGRREFTAGRAHYDGEPHAYCVPPQVASKMSAVAATASSDPPR